ncbi:hypothetical protein KIW84_055555, partial [Lathyrus oleraceus]
MAGMDVLCSDNTGTLTLNKLSVDKNLIEVSEKGVDKEHVMLLAARASRIENQDTIDAAIVGTLADPKEARAGVREIHFLPFNPVDKRTTLTYIDSNGNWHRASKGAPEQIMNLCNLREDAKRNIHAIIDKFAERGLRSLAVSRQEVPEKTKESAGGPWQFVSLLSLFDPPRHDSAETIRRALHLGVNVKMITGDQLAITKETGKSTSISLLHNHLEVFVLTTILELTGEMQSDLIQSQSITFLEILFRSALLYRFSDPMTMKTLQVIVTRLNKGRLSYDLYLQLLLAHSPFAPILHSARKPAGSFLKPISSILKCIAIPFLDHSENNEKHKVLTTKLSKGPLEIVKLLWI